MSDASPEHELEINFIKGYVERINKIISEQGEHTVHVGGPEGERFLDFTLTHYLHEASAMINPGESRNETHITLYRTSPPTVRYMLKRTVGKQLPPNIPYWGIQIMVPRELGGHRASIRYMFDQQGNGVVTHFSNEEGGELNPPYETKDLTGGDHEYIGWILQSIEKML